MATTRAAHEDPGNLDSRSFLIERLGVLFATLRIEPNAGALVGWVETLQHLHPDQIDHAVHQAMKRFTNPQYPPTPGDLLQIALEKSMTPPHPADCSRCAGSGWFYHPELKQAVRCRDYPL